MKRVLAIILAGGILTLAMHVEILARGGGGGVAVVAVAEVDAAAVEVVVLRVPAVGFLPQEARRVQPVPTSSRPAPQVRLGPLPKREHSAEQGRWQTGAARHAGAPPAKGRSPTWWRAGQGAVAGQRPATGQGAAASLPGTGQPRVR